MIPHRFVQGKETSSELEQRNVERLNVRSNQQNSNSKSVKTFLFSVKLTGDLLFSGFSRFVSIFLFFLRWFLEPDLSDFCFHSILVDLLDYKAMFVCMYFSYFQRDKRSSRQNQWEMQESLVAPWNSVPELLSSLVGRRFSNFPSELVNRQRFSRHSSVERWSLWKRKTNLSRIDHRVRFQRSNFHRAIQNEKICVVHLNFRPWVELTELPTFEFSSRSKKSNDKKENDRALNIRSVTSIRQSQKKLWSFSSESKSARRNEKRYFNPELTIRNESIFENENFWKSVSALFQRGKFRRIDKNWEEKTSRLKDWARSTSYWKRCQQFISLDQISLFIGEKPSNCLILSVSSNISCRCSYVTDKSSWH